DAKSISKAGEGIDNPLAASVNGSDVLSVRFPGAGTAPRGDASMLNCGGFGIPGNAEGWSIFYVARGSDGSGELRCKYRASGAWSADALIDGVDGFQLLYGLDTDEPRDGVPNRYVNATAIDALDDSLVLAGANEDERRRDRYRRSYWKRVVSVQVALLLRGARSARGSGTRTYDLFGPAYGAAYGLTDSGVRLTEAQLAGRMGNRARRLFTATIALRGGAR
ncbi:MAG TPA: PilW family protein, partial [Allosphingosinicella sp.]